MAITVTLYSFSKRENSTKRPSSSGTSYSCTLIDDTSLMHPTFKLEIGSNPVAYNYCYVQDFDRYYFINNIRSFQGFWYIECVEDVLASYKGTIGSQTHYVLRAASEYDEYISDSHYGAKITKTGTRLNQTGPLYWNTHHSYIVGITGYAESTSTSQVGSVTYYQMDDVGLYNFIYYLMHDISQYVDIATAPYDDVGVQEALINPIQYIVSCIGMPVGFPDSYTAATKINFGYYHWNITGSGKYRVLPRGASDYAYYNIGITKHPQASTRGKYMNAAPYSEYTFHCGPWGDIPLDPALLVDEANLGYEIRYDLTQGMARIAVGPQNGTYQQVNGHKLLYCGQAKVGVDILLAQAIVDPLQAQLSYETGMNNVIATGVGSGLSPSTASNLLKAQNALQETYVDAIKNKFPGCVSKGVPGSFLNLMDSTYGTYLLAQFYSVVDENIAEFGRPLCKLKQINTLSGFILCENADASITGTQEEAQQINAYLNSGFFYE